MNVINTFIHVVKLLSGIALYLFSLAVVIATMFTLFFPALRAINSPSDTLIGGGIFDILVSFALFSIAYTLGHLATKLLRSIFAK